MSSFCIDSEERFAPSCIKLLATPARKNSTLSIPNARFDSYISFGALMALEGDCMIFYAAGGGATKN